jgi:hypothetical protein
VYLYGFFSNDDTFEVETASSDAYLQMQLLEAACALALTIDDHNVFAFSSAVSLFVDTCVAVVHVPRCLHFAAGCLPRVIFLVSC